MSERPFWWEEDWQRYAAHHGSAVLLHGKDGASFICYGPSSTQHKPGSGWHCHLATRDEAEAERVFDEVCEALRIGLL